MKTRLWIGSQSAADSKRQCQNNGITHIVRIRENFSEFDQKVLAAVNTHWLPPIGWQLVAKYAGLFLSPSPEMSFREHSGIVYRQFKEDDHPNRAICRFFLDSTRFIHQALTFSETTRVLVHCFAGISRSSTIGLAYAIWYRACIDRVRPDVNELITEWRKARPQIDPNLGFLDQLFQWAHFCWTRQHELQDLNAISGISVRFAVSPIPAHLMCGLTRTSTHSHLKSPKKTFNQSNGRMPSKESNCICGKAKEEEENNSVTQLVASCVRVLFP